MLNLQFIIFFTFYFNPSLLVCTQREKYITLVYTGENTQVLNNLNCIDQEGQYNQCQKYCLLFEHNNSDCFQWCSKLDMIQFEQNDQSRISNIKLTTIVAMISGVIIVLYIGILVVKYIRNNFQMRQVITNELNGNELELPQTRPYLRQQLLSSRVEREEEKLWNKRLV